MDWVLGRVVDQSHCEASVGYAKITDLIFADDAVIFAVTGGSLEALHEEVKPFGLQVSWSKTKMQVFGGLLDETEQSNYEQWREHRYLGQLHILGSLVHNNDGSRQEVLRGIGLAHGVMNSLSKSIWRFSVPVQTEINSDLQVTGDPCLNVWL